VVDNARSIRPDLPRPLLTDLWVADPPGAWRALGFAVVDDAIALDGVALRLGAPELALAIDGVPAGEIDGVRTLAAAAPAGGEPTKQPNGVFAVDHFVIVSPDFDRTADALDRLEIPLRRIRDAGGFRQGFRRLGPAILELVEAQQMPPGPARIWGVTLIASDLDALAARLGPDRLRPIKDAVQPGRRIATLDRAAGLRTNVAFMDRDPG
jgi:hypothetical protein